MRNTFVNLFTEFLLFSSQLKYGLFTDSIYYKQCKIILNWMGVLIILHMCVIKLN